MHDTLLLLGGSPYLSSLSSLIENLKKRKLKPNKKTNKERGKSRSKLSWWLFQKQNKKNGDEMRKKRIQERRYLHSISIKYQHMALERLVNPSFFSPFLTHQYSHFVTIYLSGYDSLISCLSLHSFFVTTYTDFSVTWCSLFHGCSG